MEIKEKNKKIYKKNNVKVSEDYIDNITEDEERVKSFMRIYKKEEINSMNYILGKSPDNKIFTKGELELCSKIDLFNKKVVEICKHIYETEGKEVEA